MYATMINVKRIHVMHLCCCVLNFIMVKSLPKSLHINYNVSKKFLDFYEHFFYSLEVNIFLDDSQLIFRALLD